MWFDELKKVLPRFYTRQYPLNIVGYLRGAGGPEQWRVSALLDHHQLIILGNEPPKSKDYTRRRSSAFDVQRKSPNSPRTSLKAEKAGRGWHPRVMDLEKESQHATITVSINPIWGMSAKMLEQASSKCSRD